MKYQGKELSYYKSTYLGKQIGMLNAVKWIFFCIFLFGAAIFIIGGFVNNSVLIAIAGLVGCFLMCGIPMLYAFTKVKGMLKELEGRKLGEDAQAKVQLQIKNASKFQWILTGIFIAFLAVLFGSIIADGSPSKKNYKACTICSEKATNTFQGSNYCEKHYENAVKWAIDNVAGQDD